MTIGRSKEELKTLGERIRELRTGKGMTQLELAEGIVSGPMVSQIESGKSMPGARVLAVLAERLGTTVDELLRDIKIDKHQMSAYRLALSQMAVKLYLPALNILEGLANEVSLHHEIAIDELLLNLAICCRETKQYDAAHIIFYKLLGLHQTELASQNFHIRINVHLELSENYLRMGKYFEALCAATDARDEYVKHRTPDPLLHGQILLHLANIYEQTHKFDDARECYKLAIEVYSTLDDNLDELGLIYQRLAEVYYHQDNHVMTVEFANKALVSLQASRMVSEYRDAKRLAIIHQVDDENWQDSVAVLLKLAAIHAPADARKEALLYLDVAEIYLKHDLDECFNYCLQALSSLGKVQDHGALTGKANYLLGSMFQKKDELENAQLALEKAITVFMKTERLGELEKASRQLSTVYVQLGDPRKALENNEATQDFIVDQLRKRGVVL